MSQQVVINPTSHPFTAKMRAVGLKATSTRKLLSSVLLSFNHPFTADKLQEELRARKIHIHRATIYRDLLSFTQAGLLRELLIDGSQAHYYELADTHHHHHLVCSHCGMIKDITTPGVERALKVFEKTMEQSNWDITSHALKIYGSCPNCRNRKDCHATH